MTRTFSTLCAFAFALLMTTTSSQAQTAQRTFVSTTGSDANNVGLCSAANPCRSFGVALGVTNTNGEIIALTSGGYGAVTITKGVQITAPTGVYAAITASSGDGITVAAGSIDVVVLRGLTLNGLSGASEGIDFDTGGALHIENCAINGFGSRGILFDAAGELFIKDTIVRNGGVGIFITASSGTARASIDHCRIENNSGAGVFVNAGGEVTVNDSLAAGNIGSGFLVQATGKLTTYRCVSATNSNGFRLIGGGEMIVESCIARGNTNVGMLAEGTGTVMRVSNSTAVQSATGFEQSGSANFRSRGNNTVEGNDADVRQYPRVLRHLAHSDQPWEVPKC